MMDGRIEMNKHSADYVIVGAGSAGCVLAKRLSAAGHSVLLLEVGEPDRNFGSICQSAISRPFTIRASHAYSTLSRARARQGGT